MKSIHPYLNYNGNCEDAFNHYKAVFNGEITYLGRFKDAPEMGGESMPEQLGNLIMHVSLQINEHTVLMGSDAVEGFGNPYQNGNNVNISINAESREEADRIFAGLSEGGTIAMPMADQFWQSYFGMCVDRFGIYWMISFDTSAAGE